METTTQKSANADTDPVKQESPTHTGHTPATWSVHELEEGTYHIYDGFGYIGHFYSKDDATKAAAAPAAYDLIAKTIGYMDMMDATTWTTFEAQTYDNLKKWLALATGKDAV